MKWKYYFLAQCLYILCATRWYNSVMVVNRTGLDYIMVFLVCITDAIFQIGHWEFVNQPIYILSCWKEWNRLHWDLLDHWWSIKEYHCGCCFLRSSIKKQIISICVSKLILDNCYQAHCVWVSGLIGPHGLARQHCWFIPLRYFATNKHGNKSQGIILTHWLLNNDYNVTEVLRCFLQS